MDTMGDKAINPLPQNIPGYKDKKEPFLINNFVEKKKGTNNIISNDDGGGMYSYFLKGN